MAPYNNNSTAGGTLYQPQLSCLVCWNLISSGNAHGRIECVVCCDQTLALCLDYQPFCILREGVHKSSGNPPGRHRTHASGIVRVLDIEHVWAVEVNHLLQPHWLSIVSPPPPLIPTPPLIFYTRYVGMISDKKEITACHGSKGIFK